MTTVRNLTPLEKELLIALRIAERFMSGFEDMEDPEDNIDTDLYTIRSTIKIAEKTCGEQHAA